MGTREHCPEMLKSSRATPNIPRQNNTSSSGHGTLKPIIALFREAAGQPANQYLFLITSGHCHALWTKANPSKHPIAFQETFDVTRPYLWDLSVDILHFCKEAWTSKQTLTNQSYICQGTACLISNKNLFFFHMKPWARSRRRNAHNGWLLNKSKSYCIDARDTCLLVTKYAATTSSARSARKFIIVQNHGRRAN